jgi:hypothetical protein
MNTNWSRWIFASICKHFDAHKDSLTMFIEHQLRDTRLIKDFIELRMDGPRFLQASKDYWEITVEINVLIQSTLDDKDYHRIERSIGIVVNAFTNIYVLRLGNGVSDDQSLLGCLKLIQNAGKREYLQVYRLGQVDKTNKIVQAVVEGHYRMELT